MDTRNLAVVRREDMDYTSDESHLECIRGFVWALVFEGALAIAISACWWFPHFFS
jgi:hypothetical protein